MKKIILKFQIFTIINYYNINKMYENISILLVKMINLYQNSKIIII